MSQSSLPEIIYEDTDIIVCRKPAGIPTQTSRIGSRDLVSILKNYLAAGSKRPSEENPENKPFPNRHLSCEPYLAVIHRLDQPVEGLLVFAKNQKAARELNRQLTSSGFGKYYLALVAGHPDAAEATVTDYLVKDGRTNTSRVCTKEEPGAKPATLHYRVIRKYPSTSLLEIHLETGRHHQIRVQMAHLGHPLIGDRKYGSPAEKDSLKLCAYKLEFRHPTSGQAMHFELSDNIIKRGQTPFEIN